MDGTIKPGQMRAQQKHFHLYKNAYKLIKIETKLNCKQENVII